MKILKISQEELHRIIDYIPETGIFIWKISKKRVRVGDIAGSLNSDGYMQIKINNQRYRSHRLAWIYMYGDIPERLQIDHKNGIKTDNCISNIRAVTNSVNAQNQRKSKIGNASGFLGVSWRKAEKKWVAQITLNGKLKHLGYFALPELAYEAYLIAKRELHQGGML